MRKMQLIFIVLLSGLFPQQILATDWAYRFVVWEDTIFVVGEDPVTDVDKEIGRVTKYSDMRQYGGNFSNTYQKGTKYYSIQGVDTDIAIAVQVENGVYLKAESEEPYEYKGRGIYHYSLVSLVLFAVMMIGTIFFVSRAKRN